MLLARLALQLSSYLWPAYQTFKAVEANKQSLIKAWAIYWMIIGLFSTIQPVLDTLLFWVPFYYVLRLIGAIYLWYPGLQGSLHVYGRWVQPFIYEYEPLIDRRLAEFKAQLGDTCSSSVQRLREQLQAQMAVLMQQGQTKAGPAMNLQRASSKTN